MAKRKFLPPPKTRAGVSKTGAYFVKQEQARRFAKGKGTGDFIPFLWDRTATTWPENGWDHRRTDRAGYDSNTQTLRIQFHTNGAIYDYHHIPPSVARDFRRSVSPGRFIDGVLNFYDYERVY